MGVTEIAQPSFGFEDPIPRIERFLNTRGLHENRGFLESRAESARFLAVLSLERYDDPEFENLLARACSVSVEHDLEVIRRAGNNGDWKAAVSPTREMLQVSPVYSNIL
jgi:hypothetical protein